MPFVVDASVVVKTAVAEPDSALAEAFLKRRTLLSAPDLIVAEVANAVWRRVRSNDLSLAGAGAALAGLVAGRLPLLSTPPLVPAALDLALLTGTTVYDAVYLALAIRDGATLVTADERFVRAVTPHYPSAIVLLRDA